MLNSGEKNCAEHDNKNKYSNSCVIRKKNSERNKKPYPPFKLNGRSLSLYYYLYIVLFICFSCDCILYCREYS